MKKLMVAAAIAAVASIGLVGQAQAQSYYPPTSTNQAPPRVQHGANGTYGTYGTYPSQYPTYPAYPGQYPQYPQYPTTSQVHHDRHHDARSNSRYDNDGDRDDQGSNYGYGNSSTYNVPSRVAQHESAARSRTYNRRDNNARDRR